MAAQWQLNGCCGTEETIFLCFYAGYCVFFVFIYKTAFMKPMRLLAVFLHEFSHAFLCWITGGKVEAIEVNDNEGICLYNCYLNLIYLNCLFTDQSRVHIYRRSNKV